MLLTSMFLVVIIDAYGVFDNIKFGDMDTRGDILSMQYNLRYFGHFHYL